MDNRDRAAPVTLTADTPVAQAELGARLAQAFLLQHFADSGEGAVVIQAVEFFGVDQLAFLAVGVLPRLGCFVTGGGADNWLDRQAVLAGKGKVALIMRRYGHYRAFAVTHKHVVGDPYRQFLASQRVQHIQRGWQAFLFLGGNICFGHTAALALIDKGLQFGVALGGLGRQRMLGSYRNVGRAHQRVGAGGKDLQGAVVTDAGAVVRELDFHPGGLADPVTLHGLDLFRPAGQLIQRAEQLVGVVGDREVVHRDFALLDDCAAAPALAVDHLLVGQYGLVDRVPVHGAVLAVDDAFLEQAGEQPLFPTVIVGFAGGDFACPVDGQPQAFQLGTHVIDVGISPGSRGYLVVHRGVFCRHAERVPAHGLQHVLALHALVAGDHVTDGVVAHMPHV